jgi:hypothetical protein
MKLGAAKYSKSSDRDIWAAAVKAETISVMDNGSDDQFTSTGVYREMASILVRDGALQIGAYTVSHLPTFQVLLNGQIDSAGTFLVKEALAKTTHRGGASSFEIIRADKGKRIPPIVALAGAVNQESGEDCFKYFRVWGPAGPIRKGRRGRCSETEIRLLAMYAAYSTRRSTWCWPIEHRRAGRSFRGHAIGYSGSPTIGRCRTSALVQ